MEYTSNRLLAEASAVDLLQLVPDLDFVDLPRGFVLAQAGVVTDTVYFPVRGSAVVEGTGRRSAGLAAIGSDGFSGLHLLLNQREPKFSITMVSPGAGFCLSAAQLDKTLNRSLALRRLLLSNCHDLLSQIAETAMLNALARVHERAAVWLDRFFEHSLAEDLHFSHDVLADLMAVRRASATCAIHMLEGEQLIISTRKCIKLRNRQALWNYAERVRTHTCMQDPAMLASTALLPPLLLSAKHL